MSGFIGLLAPDGDAVDPLLLHRLTDALTYFAPDGSSARTSGRVGLGFAQLRLTAPRADAGQSPVAMPATDDRGVWLVADAALDERGRLARELGATGVRIDADEADAQLLLAAYRAWGTRMVEHLHGDFAFALWDGARGRLVLARDRFGVRPLYYAWAGATLVFGNALDVVRAHPGVPAGLNDAAIGDFLRIGYNTDLCTTTFAAVQCVPPAHVFVVADGSARLHRYWELSPGPTIDGARVEEHAERFTTAFRDAVTDRLRDLDDAALFMSGGRDSTAVAAMAREAVGAGGTPRLHAVTAVFDYALPDEERRYAAAAAAALGIPVEFIPQDEYRWFEAWDRADLWRPEPAEAPLLAADVDLMARAAAHARIALTGEGGDAALRERESHLARLLLTGRWLRAVMESAAYGRLHRRIPRPGFRRLRARRTGMAASYPPVPPWLRQDFIRRAGLGERWMALERADARDAAAPVGRPEAYAKLRSAFWPRSFEADHPSSTGIPLVPRHPFFDERVLDAALSLPSRQWANDKGILVAAMRGRLPDRVRLRSKTPLAGDGYDVAFAAAGRVLPSAADFCPEALAFIDPDALHVVTPQMDATDVWDWTRAYSLSLWLQRLSSGRGMKRASGGTAALLAP